MIGHRKREGEGAVEAPKFTTHAGFAGERLTGKGGAVIGDRSGDGCLGLAFSAAVFVLRHERSYLSSGHDSHGGADSSGA